jgi:hypothetical protein
MGCGSSASSNAESNERSSILRVKVNSVPKLTDPNQIEEFKKKYLSNDYIHENDSGYKERMDNTREIQYKRWDWMTQHPDIYVNMLRLSNHPDENIQACLDGKRPLCFTSAELYSEFLSDLVELKAKLESETEFKNVRFIQAGSSVAGFSNNPHKGFRDQPSKITDVGKSDVDIVVVANGVKAFINKERPEKLIYREYPSTSSRTSTEIRFGLKDWIAIPPLKSWRSKWKVKMGGGVQLTLQDGVPITPPWEPYIILPR